MDNVGNHSSSVVFERFYSAQDNKENESTVILVKELTVSEVKYTVAI